MGSSTRKLLDRLHDHDEPVLRASQKPKRQWKKFVKDAPPDAPPVAPPTPPASSPVKAWASSRVCRCCKGSAWQGPFENGFCKQCSTTFYVNEDSPLRYKFKPAVIRRK